MSFQRLFESYATMCPETRLSFIHWNVPIILAKLQNIHFNYNKLWFGLYGHHQKYQITKYPKEGKTAKVIHKCRNT